MNNPQPDSSDVAIRKLLERYFGFSESGYGIEQLDDAIAAIQTLLVEAKEDTHKVTRFEVIDLLAKTNAAGRIMVKNGIKVYVSYQDDDRTLKVFIADPNTTGEDKS